jgi:predicted nucleic-acid-binding protein
MSKCFVDTNLFIRYLTNDEPELADRVEKLLDQAGAGELQLITTELVIAETVWVLESSYKLKNREVAPLVRGILATPGLEVVNADMISRALMLYELQNIDFVDASITVFMEKQGIADIYSYDKKHLARVTGINRREP